MRSNFDRLRHTILFEVLLLAICIPLFSWVFDKPAHQIGLLSILLSLAAMSWNYIYNLMFDHGLRYLGKQLYPRSFPLRIFHAVLFELGLLFVSIPAVMYFMDFSFLQALTLDLAFVILTPVFTVFYNYFYDMVFPV
ncbi:MAG: PACE efflux transporter, partial [Desulfobacterales bacterium]|nr:PACE efflux transporter [Desulfobacterales bacterium]